MRKVIKIGVKDYPNIPKGACVIVDWDVFQLYRKTLLKDKTCYIIGGESDPALDAWLAPAGNVSNNGKSGVLSFIYKDFTEAESHAYYALKEVYYLKPTAEAEQMIVYGVWYFNGETESLDGLFRSKEDAIARTEKLVSLGPKYVKIKRIDEITWAGDYSVCYSVKSMDVK